MTTDRPGEARMTDQTTEERHRDALADTNEAYTSFHGWTLRCLWCPHTTQGRTKAEALALMEDHYTHVLPEGATLR